MGRRAIAVGLGGDDVNLLINDYGYKLFIVNKEYPLTVIQVHVILSCHLFLDRDLTLMDLLLFILTLPFLS